MLTNQKDLFRLPKNITYLNGAYMSPQLKSVENIGHEAVSKKCFPHQFGAEAFFEGPKNLKKVFAKLIDVPDYNNTAIIPSASYGLANAANNVNLESGDEIIIVDAQFPSNVYAWQKVAEKKKAKVKVISPPLEFKNRGKQWNQNILDAINSKTAVVTLGPTHWADGTLFDLKAIREKSKLYNAALIIDASQFIGADAFSVKEIQPEAVITVGYKWLMGPYGLGMAYYSDAFNDGEPIENNWINRYKSEDFTQLVNYNSGYQPKAGRYNMGECSNFISVAMLTESINQILKWQPQHIQDYCDKISKKAINRLRNLECFIEDDEFRSKHLFGVYLPKNIQLQGLKAKFKAEQIYVSYRGDAIRVSPNVYNSEEDFEKFVGCFSSPRNT
ncbi:aminotransferase class V-fold PLP-dependent enzyme [Aureibaculum sp. 2210JD6-5]|uniref:aminotransferase class V-fold PLP-dependent enzyme n=1 Tax=Aureibaculum sp. 2210JD6-5 TaxID=3103957 RepID=UPI002AAE22D1|nr:aminotransferase class V-fold PLP-dependent enzyme [Aureibaculum sp. 2210JD6-5]MDY7395936.1 aminotransferase class V-fold PLP-dependent enzyme [Aureibaculum sp. 2210JD6-5]